jgi:2-polyprenyl-3-methyl-5-hydroxy-6-metoxy-1,4-benzoquinol methylase
LARISLKKGILMDLIENDIKDPINHWYYKHKFWFIKKAIDGKGDRDKTLIDVGAGSALFSKELLRIGAISSAVAVDTGYHADSTDKEFDIKYQRDSDYRGFSIYLMTDVLEHIENDFSFLEMIVNKASSGSKFVITVPAHQSLWSQHDVYLKHFRRYTKKELVTLVSKSGIEMLECRYTYSTLFFIAYLQRKFLSSKENESQMREHNAAIQGILKLMLIPDKFLSKLPFGVSLFVYGVKND